MKSEEVYNPYQYTGRRYDEESELYYYRARMYSPEMSRFTSNDPAGMVDGANMYAYVGNNPTNRRDPSGETGMFLWARLPFLFQPGGHDVTGFLGYTGAMDYDVGEKISQHIPKPKLDSDEYKKCLVEDIKEVGSEIAACIVTAVPVALIASIAISSGIAISSPEPVSTSIAAEISLAQIGAVGLAISACFGGSEWKGLQHALETVYCGIKSIKFVK